MNTRTTAIRTAALGAAGVLAAGATFLSLQPTAEATPVAAVAKSGRSAETAGLPRGADLTQYVQRHDTVTVYRGGKKIATVTPRSAAHARGKGELVLDITAVKAFSFPARQFIWEAPDGGDHLPADLKQKVKVAAGATTTATIRYDDGVGDGDVIWATSSNEVDGLWTVDGDDVDGRPGAIPRQYLQRGSTVTVFKGGRVVADVTPTSATYQQGTGNLSVKVNAVRAFGLYPESFIWEDPDGGDHTAVGGPEKITVPAGTTHTYRISYHGVGAGDAIFVPAPDTVAGIWTIG